MQWPGITRGEGVDNMPRTEYENRISDQLLRTGAFVQQEPLIEGKTPDILAKSASKSDCLI